MPQGDASRGYLDNLIWANFDWNTRNVTLYLACTRFSLVQFQRIPGLLHPSHNFQWLKSYSVQYRLIFCRFLRLLLSVILRQSIIQQSWWRRLHGVYRGRPTPPHQSPTDAWDQGEGREFTPRIIEGVFSIRRNSCHQVYSILTIFNVSFGIFYSFI